MMYAGAKEIADQIASTFGGRSYPETFTQRGKTHFADEDEVNFFKGKSWRDIDYEDLHRASCALYHFSDEAFCYFLPGVLIATLRSNFKDNLVYNVLIECFSNPHNSFWASRSQNLSSEELEAVKGWFTAFKESKARYDRERINQALQTIDTLIERARNYQSW